MSVKQDKNDLGRLSWFKSSYSGSDGGDCVEVAAAPGTMHVRDSKDSGGPMLSFPHDAWSAFVAYAKRQTTERF
jgi:hypothetical protein